jgi:hypothetical protein
MDMSTVTEYPVATRWEMITGETPPADLNRIPTEQAEALVHIFAPYAQQIQTLTPDAWDLTVTAEDDHAGMQRAGRMRKALREIRLEAEKLRKQHKEYSLVTGRVVDWFGRQVTGPAARAEAHLEAQEKYAEIKQEERRQALAATRLEILRPIADDLSAFGDLAAMSDVAFERLRAMLRAAHDKAEAEAAERRRLEAEQRAEADRLRVENERIRAENIRYQQQLDQERAARERSESQMRAETTTIAPPRFDSLEPDAVEIEIYTQGDRSVGIAPDVITITVPGAVWFSLAKDEQAEFMRDAHAAIGPWLDGKSNIQLRDIAP